MVGFAIRRLASEFKNLIDNPTEGIVAGPINENNMLEWEALCIAPEGCDFDGGVFKIRLDFTLDYPLAPPTARFVTNIFHPNVYQDGRICISILHAPGDDPSGYESKNERWSPSQSIEKILLSIISLLAEPNVESPANVDAAKMFRNDYEKFKQIASSSVKNSLYQPDK